MTLIELVANKCDDLNIQVDMWNVMKFLCPNAVIDGLPFACVDGDTFVECPRCWLRKVDSESMELVEDDKFMSELRLVDDFYKGECTEYLVENGYAM